MTRIYLIHSSIRNQRSNRTQRAASVSRFSCTPPGLLSQHPRQDRAHLQSYFDEPPLQNLQGSNCWKIKGPNTAVIISYSPMNASFIRERQRYKTVVTAGPLSTHHMILFATPLWKKKTFSALQGCRKIRHKLLVVWPKTCLDMEIHQYWLLEFGTDTLTTPAPPPPQLLEGVSSVDRDVF